MQYNLSLLWQYPNVSAERVCHSALNPILERSHSTRSNPRTRSIGLFSMMMYLGLTLRIIRNISDHKPLLVPLIPVAFMFAIEISWQGNPPEIISTYSGCFNSLISAYCFEFGKFCLSICLLYSSISQFHNVPPPSSRGLGHGLFKPVTRVRISLGVHQLEMS